MSSVNKQILVGHLSRDPERRTTRNGKVLCKLSVATNRRDNTPDFHRVTVWGPAAEFCAEYLLKGRQVYVEGETRHDKGKDGRVWTEVHAFVVTALGDRKDAPPHEDYEPPEDDNDGIPF